jgi:DNA-binding CsgD family transcriptional regulator
MARRGSKETAAATATAKRKGAAGAQAHARPANRGGRAVPGKAPLGPFHPRSGGKLTSLGRLILDRLDRGVIMLDATGFVLDANVPALRVLNEVDGITIRNGRLRFVDAVFDERLKRLIAQCQPGATGAARPIAARFKRRRAQSYFVLVSPVPTNVDERDVVLTACIYATDGRRGISTELLQELYGLTRAQAEVARRLFAGRNVEQAAKSLRLSPNTVRTHLKQIFTKCEVQSQAELMHLLAQGPSSL